MLHRNCWLAALLLIAGLGLAACGQTSPVAAGKEKPSKVEKVAGADNLSRVTLTPKAAERLGIQTAPVREEPVGGAQRKVVPYGALLYDAKGDTWVYTSPEPLVFVRQAVAVERIDGDLVILTEGPEVGTPVVTVGAPELYGTEYGVGH